MPSTSKIRTEFKCRYDALACQLMSHGTHLQNCKTEQELLADSNDCIKLAREFINRVTKFHGRSQPE